MAVFHSFTKGDLSRRRSKQSLNLILNFVKEALPTMHISKSERVDIFNFFKNLHHDYWANQQGELVMVPVMDAAEPTLTILCYTQHLAKMANVIQRSWMGTHGP